MKRPTKSLLPLAFLPLVIFGFLLLARRWVPVHDTLHNVMWYQQMLSLMSVAEGWPLWDPSLAWGMNTNLTNLAVLSPSQLFLMPIAKLTQSWNAATLFYVACLLDEALLVIGAWLLSQKLSETLSGRLFFVLSVSVGSFWGTQVYWNFRIFAFLPLALYFLLDGLDRKSPARLIVGVAIVVFCSAIGNLLYCASILALLVLVLVASYAILNKVKLPPAKSWRKHTTLSALLLLTLTALVPAAILASGPRPALTGPGRETDGSVSYDIFLDYGNGKESITLKQLVNPFYLGLDPEMRQDQLNNAAYAGAFFFAFLFLGLVLGRGPLRVPLLLTSGVLFGLYLAKGFVLASFFYYLPVFSMFRHFGLLPPLLKFFVLGIATLGWDAWVRALVSRESKDFSRVTVLMLAGLAFSGALLGVFYWQAPADAPFRYQRFYVELVCLLGLAALCLRRLWLGLPKNPALFLGIALFLIAANLMSYRAVLWHTFLAPVSAEVWSLFGYQEPKFAQRRVPSVQAAPEYQPLGRQVLYRAGELYSIVDPFLGVDVCRAEHRVDTMSPWAAPLYMTPAAQHPTMKEFAAGCLADRVQIFSSVAVLNSPESVLKTLNIPRREGSLLVDAEEWNRIGGDGPTGEGRSTFSRAYSVTEYRPEHLTLTVAQGTEPSWLYLADTWYPHWTALVNGNEAPVMRANHAFKAVKVPAEGGVVEFIYHSPFENYLWTWMWVLSFGLIGLTVGLIGLALLPQTRLSRSYFGADRATATL